MNKYTVKCSLYDKINTKSKFERNKEKENTKNKLEKNE